VRQTEGMTMIDPAKEQEHRAEAERLAKLPRSEQRVIVAWHRDIAADPKVRKADRQLAGERAKALERLLFRAKTGQKK
jgi:hypothetical protein